ncbi:MAG TPA: dihydrofolate reductase family protein [Candidatus Limnocylindrales bacterium]|nr:dihydrofolate reductase family protein [Candidatus Limnocylindrales bacterium]
MRPVHWQMITGASDKNIWLVGGGALVGQFYDHGLLDEMIVTIVSVTLDNGAPLLPRPITTPPLRLISVTARDGDPLVTLWYEVPRP